MSKIIWTKEPTSLTTVKTHFILTLALDLPRTAVVRRSDIFGKVPGRGSGQCGPSLPSYSHVWLVLLAPPSVQMSVTHLRPCSPLTTLGTLPPPRTPSASQPTPKFFFQTNWFPLLHTLLIVLLSLKTRSELTVRRGGGLRALRPLIELQEECVLNKWLISCFFLSQM